MRRLQELRQRVMQCVCKPKCMDKGKRTKVTTESNIEDQVLRLEEGIDAAPARRPVSDGRAKARRIDGARVPGDAAGDGGAREEPDADACFRKLGDEDTSAGRCEPSAIRRGRGVGDNATLVGVRLEGAIGAVHKGRRLNG